LDVKVFIVFLNPAINSPFPVGVAWVLGADQNKKDVMSTAVLWLTTAGHNGLILLFLSADLRRYRVFEFVEHMFRRSREAKFS